ncbi:MAG: efflux transporter outer membrane subunit [Phycisphaeraceae bacterium]|nr:efflux transporter outer membrane subunit [Phycisphaeraceae bacterium]
MRKSFAVCMPILLSLAACTVGPEYKRPDLTPPASFRTLTEGTLDAIDTAWWSGFRDPVLDDLVSEALRNNIDVRIAASRVDQFASRVGISRAASLPSVGYDASAGRAQRSRETAAAGGPRVLDFFEANLNLGWELDVFGRVRRTTDAAIADALASEEARRGVILSLVSSVATSYIALRSLDQQLAIANRVLETRRETLRIFELQFERGVVSRLELSQIRSELERTATAIPALHRDIGTLENAISVLLGRAPGDVARGLPLAELATPPVPAGLPSDLLTRRPDLRAAEQNLVAANARVGAAIADFYPRFALTGAMGFASDDLGRLFTSPAGAYTIAAGVAGPLFTAGLLESRLQVSRAVEREALDTYRGAVLTALREAEDALITRAMLIEEVSGQSRQVEELTQYASLALKRYDNGYVGYLEVLDAERALFDAQLQQARLQASLLASSVGLYKAFGGGWVSIAESLADGSAPDTRMP